MIVFQTVSLAYGQKQVFDQFSYRLPAQGITCLFGPSGCGKTSFLRLAAGLSHPDAGKISGIPKKPAFLFQENRLIPHISALANIQGVLPKERQAEGGHWLSRIGLSGEEHTLPRKLSGGMQRRVALARALAYGGDYLFLDEPFAGLDHEKTKAMIDLILAQNTPTLLVTHSMEDIRRLGAQVLHVKGLPLQIV